MRTPSLLLLLLCLALPVRAARADQTVDSIEAEREGFLRRWAGRSLDRGRRSLTLGPFLGLGAGFGLDTRDPEAQLTAGLALLRYDISLLPSADRLRDVLESRFRSELARRLRELVAGGGQPTEDDERRLAREVWQQIRGELLLELQPRRWEKPSFAVRTEVGRMLERDAWDLRLLVGIGLGPVTVSAGTSLRLEDGAALVVPVELAKPMLLSRGLRAPVLDWFLRAELAATGRGEREDTVLLGARLLLDVI